MRLLQVLFILPFLLITGCEDNDLQNPNSPSPTPVTTTVSSSVTRIEYRVSGNATGVRVRYSNPVDGLTQVVTTLPYVATVSTSENSIFLSLEATPTLYPFNVQFPFLSVQVFVNGVLFREATSNDYLLNPISVSGTWRK